MASDEMVTLRIAEGQQARYERAFASSLSVRCPTCQALPGQWCEVIEVLRPRVRDRGPGLHGIRRAYAETYAWFQRLEEERDDG
jgi:hypothetical protein